MGLYKLIEKKQKAAKRRKNVKVAKYATLTAVIGALGVTSGVLLAPKSGKETREAIAKKAKNIKSNAHDKANTIKENLNSKVNDTKEEVKIAKDKIAEYLAEKKNKKSKNIAVDIPTDNESVENKDIHDVVNAKEEAMKE